MDRKVILSVDILKVVQCREAELVLSVWFLVILFVLSRQKPFDMEVSKYQAAGNVSKHKTCILQTGVQPQGLCHGFQAMSSLLGLI